MSDETRGEDGLAWLEGLEGSVERAAERLGALRQDNARLAARVAELEQAVAEQGEASAAGDNQQEAAWMAERSQVRQRVEALAESLEELLSTDA